MTITLKTRIIFGLALDCSLLRRPQTGNEKEGPRMPDQHRQRAVMVTLLVQVHGGVTHHLVSVCPTR